MAGGYVYVTSYIREGPYGIVHCLDASTGEMIWNHTTPEYTRFPVVADGYVYTTYDNYKFSENGTSIEYGGVYAFDALTGASNCGTTQHVRPYAHLLILLLLNTTGFT